MTHKIQNPHWRKTIVRDFRNSSTTRQGIDDIGRGVTEIINLLQNEGGLAPIDEGWREFTRYRMEDVEFNQADPKVSDQVKEKLEGERYLWKAVDQVVHLYCHQLLMTDAEVEEAVKGSKIMEAFPDTKPATKEEALIEIFERLHKWGNAFMRSEETARKAGAEVTAI